MGHGGPAVHRKLGATMFFLCRTMPTVDEILLVLSAWRCALVGVRVCSYPSPVARKHPVAQTNLHGASKRPQLGRQTSRYHMLSQWCKLCPYKIKQNCHSSLTARLNKTVRAEVSLRRRNTLSMQEAHRYAAAFSTGRSAQHTRCSAWGVAGASRFVAQWSVPRAIGQQAVNWSFGVPRILYSLFEAAVTASESWGTSGPGI